MNTSPDTLDTLLQTSLLQPPDDFSREVMRRIQELPPPQTPNPRTEWLQWLALAAGMLLGLEKLAAFIFGVWLASVAG